MNLDLLKRGSVWAIVDQAVVSAGNFATVLFLARALAPAEFGTFALLNAACLIVIGLHSSIIVSPLVVTAASASDAKSRTYSMVALAFTLAFLPVSFLVIFLASVFLHSEFTGLLAVFYILAWQLQETTRRSLIARLRYSDALWGDCTRYLGQALLVGLLMRARGTLNEAFLLMATTSLVAAAVQYSQGSPTRATWAEFRQTGSAFWKLGRWLAVASVISSAAGPLYPWLVNWFHGREAAATFQAVSNVLSLSNPIIGSIPAIVIPGTAHFLLRRSEDRAMSLLRFAVGHVFRIEVILAPLFLLLAICPRIALTLFYGRDSAYCHETLALRIGVLAWILLVPMTVFLAVLAGAGKTKGNAAVLGAGTTVAIVCAPPLIFAGGVVGGMLTAAVERGASVLTAIRLIGASSATGGDGSVGSALETSADS